MTNSYGLIEVDMFPPEVNSVSHPDVIRFKKVLEEVAEEYHCQLLSFDIDCGTVIFSFDSDELTAEIIKILQDNDEG